MNFAKNQQEDSVGKSEFSKGYLSAVANIIRTHGDISIASDVFACNAMSLEEMRAIGVDESDIETLAPIIGDRKRRGCPTIRIFG